MKRKFLCSVLALLLILPGCTAPASNGAASGTDQTNLTIVATTYPVYLFVSAVVGDVEGVSVQRLNTGETSCLHDYTLSVDDMKRLEGADVIAMNGVELEKFMEDALAASDATAIDCAQGVALLETLGHVHEEGNDHGHYDPHIWMDPNNVEIMVNNVRDALVQLDPGHKAQYEENARTAAALLASWDVSIRDILAQLKDTGKPLSGLITFHDGFQYFAAAYDLPLLAAIEEEAGSEASGKEILEITQLVQQHQIPVIFTEVNGSEKTANAISRETGVQVAQLTMLMDGPDDQLSNYFNGLFDNMVAIVNGFAGEEVVK